MRKSRDNWRKKAVFRHREIRNAAKREARRLERYVQLETANHQLKAVNTELLARNGQLERRNREHEQEIATLGAMNSRVIRLDHARLIRILCVLLVMKGVVSFRSVPRILGIFSLLGYCQIARIPHFTSVINWTLRVGLALLREVAPVVEPWIALVDISIDVSIKKALVVLRVSLKSLQDRKGKAITLQDCQCIGIEVADTWNGETVEVALTKIFSKSGRPIAILKDGGGDLGRGVRLWRDNNAARSVAIIDDVGHVAANALKAAYNKKTAFKRFLASITRGAARLRQSDLAFLTPPKIRTKGRFQSIMRVAEWGEKILNLLGGQGRQAQGSLAGRLRSFLPGFGTHRTFLETFALSSKVVSNILKILKNQGLNQETYRQVDLALATLPARSQVRRRMTTWLQKHLAIQCRMGIKQVPLLVSSDILESLFGKFKVILQRNHKAEFNRIVLAFPGLCGDLSEDHIERALAGVSQQELNAWEKMHVIDSQAKRRMAVLPPQKIGWVPKSVRAA